MFIWKKIPFLLEPRSIQIILLNLGNIYVSAFTFLYNFSIALLIIDTLWVNMYIIPSDPLLD